MSAAEIKFPMEKDVLEAFVPHKSKMYLLSRALDFDLEKSMIKTQCDVGKENIFFDEEAGGIPNWAGFELMAQTISALTGISNTIKGIPLNPGMVLSVSDFVASVDFYKDGETVTMRVQQDFFDAESSMYRYLCWIYADEKCEKEIASAKITVMEISQKTHPEFFA